MNEVIATTPTQYAFAICFLVVAPLLAIFAAYAQSAGGEHPWKGAVIAGGVSWAGWIASGVCAATLFPRYPAGGSPSEPVAMLFVLPGLLAGMATVRWFATRRVPIRSSTLRTRMVLAGWIVVAAVLAVVLVAAHRSLTTWPGRRELPGSAEVIEERISEDDFLGDFEYVIRARMSERIFREWMRRLDVQPTEDPTRYGVPLDYGEHECGSEGTYADGVGTFRAWCS